MDDKPIIVGMPDFGNGEADAPVIPAGTLRRGSDLSPTDPPDADAIPALPSADGAEA